MGLDWNPGHRPRAGHAAEFRRIVETLGYKKLSPADRLEITPAPQTVGRGGGPWTRPLLRRYAEISVSAFETLGAPCVGRDVAADAWARKTFDAEESSLTFEDWFDNMRGFYVLDLAPPCDGLPPYSNGPAGYVEAFSFRAELLKRCAAIIGARRLKAAHYLRFSEDLIDYGEELIDCAQQLADDHAITIPNARPNDLLSAEGRLHIVLSAGRWCRFWGERGHLLDPYIADET